MQPHNKSNCTGHRVWRCRVADQMTIATVLSVTIHSAQHTVWLQMKTKDQSTCRVLHPPAGRGKQLAETHLRGPPYGPREVLSPPTPCRPLIQCNNNTKTTVLRPFVRDYPGEPQKKDSPTHHPDDHPIFISFFHLPRAIASSLFKLRAWQSFCTTSFNVLFGLLLGLEPSTSYSIHFFTQGKSP